MTRKFTGTCKTQWHLIVALLWQEQTWLPTHKLQSVDTGFGFIGSSGEQRVRELARNAPCIPEALRGKIEKKREGKYEFFRYAEKPSRSEYVAAAKCMCELFDAGAPVEQIFAV